MAVHSKHTDMYTHRLPYIARRKTKDNQSDNQSYTHVNYVCTKFESSCNCCYCFLRENVKTLEDHYLKYTALKNKNYWDISFRATTTVLWHWYFQNILYTQLALLYAKLEPFEIKHNTEMSYFSFSYESGGSTVRIQIPLLGRLLCIYKKRKLHNIWVYGMQRRIFWSSRKTGTVLLSLVNL
jgi:hypothetical protein